MLQIASWNTNQRAESWRTLLDSNVDIALLQEAKPPPPELLSQIEIDQQTPWHTAGVNLNRPWRAAIARFTDRVSMEPYRLNTIEKAKSDEFAVSRLGTLAISNVTIHSTGEKITLVSAYGAWESPLKDTGSSWIYADASVHRVISDISALVGRQQGHKIIVAGDLNSLHGYGERSSKYWKNRYDTIFNRMKAIGIPFIGPQAPDGGVQATPWPSELPQNSLNIPTFRTNRKLPETATRQLDFVFASESFGDRLRVRAMNNDDEWGPSDHCRILIELEDM